MVPQPPNAFKALRILHLALVAGMMVFAVVAIVLISNGFTVPNTSMERPLQVACVIFSLSAGLLGFNLFKKNIIAARNSTEPGVRRMDLYRAACILWWALIEAPGLLATIGFLLTGNYAFLALSVFHILLLLAFMPRKDNIIMLLNLSSSDVDELGGNS